MAVRHWISIITGQRVCESELGRLQRAAQLLCATDPRVFDGEREALQAFGLLLASDGAGDSRLRGTSERAVMNLDEQVTANFPAPRSPSVVGPRTG